MKSFRFNKQTDNLFKAVLSLKDTNEAEKFFRDLCTVDEIKEMSDRWQIVNLLQQNKPYREIAAKVKTSTTTVSRVAMWLNNGSGGYQLVFERLNHQHQPTSGRKGLR